MSRCKAWQQKGARYICTLYIEACRRVWKVGGHRVGTACVLLWLLTGCATCQEHPIACSVGGVAIALGMRALAEHHSTTPHQECPLHHGDAQTAVYCPH